MGFLCEIFTNREKYMSIKDSWFLNFILLLLSLITYALLYKFLIHVLGVNEQYKINILTFVLIYIAYIIIIFLLKLCAAKHSSKSKDKLICGRNKVVKMYCEYIPAALLSPDFYITDAAKRFHFSNCDSNPNKKTKSSRKSYVLQKYNYYNLTFSSILLLIVVIFKKYFPNESQAYICLLLFMGIRVISRSVEICYAFYVDVTSEVETSSLNRTDRLRLAVYSYIELIFSYAAVYMLLDNTTDSPVLWETSLRHLFENILFSVGNITLSDSSLSSIYRNGELTDLGNMKYLIALQVISGLILTVFAIASYLGTKKN